MVAWTLASCSDKAPSQKTAGSLTGPATMTTAPADGGSAAPAARREDLGKLTYPLAASIDVPPDATVASDREERRDKYGLMYNAPVAQIARGDVVLAITPDVEYGTAPTTLAAEIAGERGRREAVAQREAPTGEWAIAFPWSESTCEVRGWSPRTQLICRAASIKVPCAEVAWMLDACITLAPSGPPLDPPWRTLKGGGVDLDLDANRAAVATARALATDDRAALVGQIGPRGLMLKGKRVTRAQLEALLRDESIAKLVDFDCAPIKDRIPGCAWNTGGDGQDGTLVVLPDNGGGVMPQFTYTRAGESTWHLARIDLVDQGDP